MAIKKLKPTSPARRHMSVMEFDEITTYKSSPASDQISFHCVISLFIIKL